jgi:hypothetical protein
MSACSPMDRLLQTILITAPGVPQATVQVVLFNTIDEFFRRTSAWKIENDIAIEENTYIYDIAIPPDSVVVRAMGATHNGIPVASTASGVVQSSTGTMDPELTFPDGDANFAPFRLDLVNPPNTFTYSLFRPNFISVTAPTEEARKYPLKLVLALSVAQGCLECDCGDWQLEDWMYSMFFEDWLDGVLGTLFTMPAKPWSNPQLAIYHKKRFRNFMNYRKQEAKRGFVHNVQTWRYPRWA